MNKENLKYPWIDKKEGYLYCEKCKSKNCEKLDDYSIYNDGLWNFCVKCGKRLKTEFNNK